MTGDFPNLVIYSLLAQKSRESCFSPKWKDSILLSAIIRFDDHCAPYQEAVAEEPNCNNNKTSTRARNEGEICQLSLNCRQYWDQDMAKAQVNSLSRMKTLYEINIVLRCRAVGG